MECKKSLSQRIAYWAENRPMWYWLSFVSIPKDLHPISPSWSIHRRPRDEQSALRRPNSSGTFRGRKHLSAYEHFPMEDRRLNHGTRFRVTRRVRR